MWKFTKELAAELADYPLQTPLNIEGFCFHIGKLHHELVRMPEDQAAALLYYFGSLRELLDFYSAGEGLRPVLPADKPEQAVQVQPVQDAVTLRTAYVWRHADDSENKGQLPDAHNWSGALSYNVENAQEKDALESLLIKRVAARRVPAFCFALDYALADGTHARADGEAWRCLPDTLPMWAKSTAEFSTARVPAHYRLMGAAPAMRACQVFAAQYLTKMNALKRVHLDI
jgi:hypothetical protein